MRVEDVLSDLDLLTIDRQVFTHFGQQSYATVGDKRRLAVSDWLAGELKARGYDPSKHVTRMAPDYCAAITGATETDLLDDISDRQTDPVDLHDLIVTPSTDYLIVGHTQPFKALTVTMTDTGNTSSLSIASLTYWNGGRWQSLGANSLIDTTRVTQTSISLAGGGSFRFVPPDDWTPKPGALVTEPWVFLVRLQMSQRPSADTLVHQLTPTRQSRLTYAAGLYALHLLCLEAAKGSRSDWDDRAAMYATKAEAAIARDVLLAQDEFDMDNSGAIAALDVSSAVPPIDLHTWERG